MMDVPSVPTPTQPSHPRTNDTTGCGGKAAGHDGAARRTRAGARARAHRRRRALHLLWTVRERLPRRRSRFAHSRRQVLRGASSGAAPGGAGEGRPRRGLARRRCAARQRQPRARRANAVYLAQAVQSCSWGAAYSSRAASSTLSESWQRPTSCCLSTWQATVALIAPSPIARRAPITPTRLVRPSSALRASGRWGTASQQRTVCLTCCGARCACRRRRAQKD